MSDDTQQFEEGANKADPEYNAQECADVKAWQKKIEDARKFDEPARKQIALSRRYARGDAGDFEIKIPIAPSYVDILSSLLYAKNPDLDVQPSEATNPPPMADIIDMAREKVGSDPQTHMLMEQVGIAATQRATQAMNQAVSLAPTSALDPGAKAKIALLQQDPNHQPEALGEQAAQAWLNTRIQQEAKTLMQPYHKRLSRAKQYGKTIEIVVTNLWKKANVKKQIGQQLRSTITAGPGWLKVTWQERAGKDPIVLKAIQDAQDQLALLDAAQTELEQGEAPDDDLARAEINQRIQGLEAQVEIIVARGLAADFVRAEDTQVANGVPMENYLDAPWIAHRAYFAIDEAKAKFPAIAKELEKATVHIEKKPIDTTEVRHIGPGSDVAASDADAYSTGVSAVGNDAQAPQSVCVWEVWDKSKGMVITLVEGVDKYAIKPYAPSPGTTRFYPMFLLAMLWVDGDRHPQSLIQRSMSLLDEVNRLHSNRALHRRRTIPKTAFDATNLEQSEAEKITKGGTQELVPLKTIIPGTPVSNLISVIQYAKVDEALYNDREVMAKLEIVWAIQEALASSINVQKTATEAEIQQTGTNARTGHKRSAIDAMMDELAEYTAEVALQKLSHQDVVQIAGPWAFWPEGSTLQDMSTLVTVQIKGGSTGRPNTSAQQQAWASIFPIVKESIVQIGQLRQSAPTDIADGIEELVNETFARTGEPLDASRFIPNVPSNEPGSMPQQQGAPPSADDVPTPGPQPAPQQPPPNQLPVPQNHNGSTPGAMLQ